MPYRSRGTALIFAAVAARTSGRRSRTQASGPHGGARSAWPELEGQAPQGRGVLLTLRRRGSASAFQTEGTIDSDELIPNTFGPEVLGITARSGCLSAHSYND